MMVLCNVNEKLYEMKEDKMGEYKLDNRKKEEIRNKTLTKRIKMNEKKMRVQETDIDYSYTQYTTNKKRQEYKERRVVVIVDYSCVATRSITFNKNRKTKK